MNPSKDIAGSELLKELLLHIDNDYGEGLLDKYIAAHEYQAIQAFGEKQIEAFEKAIYRYELTRDYPEGNLSKPIMEYYRTSIQEAMQSSSPDRSAK